MSRLVAMLCALALVSGACIGGGDAEAPSVFSVAELTGAPVGKFPGAAVWRALKQGEEIPAGTALRLMRSDDVVRLSRGEQIEVELRSNEPTPDGEIAAEATVVAADEVLVRTGDALARAEGAVPLRLQTGDGIQAAASNGTFRLDRRVSLRVGVYEGSVDVTGPAGNADLPRLREAQPQNGAPGPALPLTIVDDDPWDLRFLAGAIDLDHDLAAQIAGYEGEFGARTRSVDELSAIARDVRKGLGFIAGSLDRHRAGDVLVALMLSLLVESRSDEAAPAVFYSLLDLRSSGATWGVIAADRKLEPAEVLAVVVRGVGLRTGVVRPGTGSTIGPTSRPTSRPTSTRSPTASPTPTRTPTRSPSPTASPSPTRSASPSPSPSPTSTNCSDLDRLLGNC